MSAIPAASPRTHYSQFPHAHTAPAAFTFHQPVAPEVEFVPTVEGLAQAMRDQFPECTEQSLQAEGFCLAFQQRHGDAARALATKTFVRQVEATTATYDREGRIERAANLAAGLVSYDAIASYLLANNYRPRELGDLMPDVIARMCEIVVGRDLEPAQVK